ncbi:MAG: gamma-glutamyltransferase [Rhodospirillales bacterium]|nr:gamma-glutamyltransferase [Rhodospirillales bacterium]MDP6883425.1 gamma-glutamyltransferase [Rhodospirillales bacterium]
MTSKGIIAAGHGATAGAARVILDEGGNAFDAALAALLAACVAEPILTSLGGGGFLLARPAAGDRGGETVIYDFFAQTPKKRRLEADFFPITADFGTAQQEFHIGMGSIATPGTVKGLFAVHRDLGSMPLARIVEPALALARGGLVLNGLQAYIFGVVGAIYTANAACRDVFASRHDPARPIGEGETLVMPQLADSIEALAREGEDLFYLGEIGQRIVADCGAGGGHLTVRDLADYRVRKRAPLCLDYRDARLSTNPPPSAGGILVAFSLELLRHAEIGTGAFGGADHLALLARVMDLTNKARVDSKLHATDGAPSELLNPDFIAAYRSQVLGRPAAKRGTTHVSIIDARGNAASLSLTNGEGSAYIVPATGIMLNNMLGEEDLNPHGFHQWPGDRRLCSMLTPTLILRADGRLAVMGSGGSNRIRTAILQTLVNTLDFAMTLEDAVSRPRIHFEGGLLSIEPGFDNPSTAALEADFPKTQHWQERNMFFGGVHAVEFEPSRRRFSGVGDARRDGVVIRA